MPLLPVLFLATLANSWPIPDQDIWRNSTRNARVLNFFPIPVEEECQARDSHRRGICLNAYECRIQGGRSSGPCALGFGVCCVFLVSCGAEVINNITYFVNPDFPGLSKDMSSCEINIKKIDPEISQFRLDFVHFQLGQPNRRTGVCDEDVFVLGGGSAKELKMCGINSGQHVYLDVEDVIDEPVNIRMRLKHRSLSRLWEVRVVQVPFQGRAPPGCLQYHTGLSGVVQSMNFADNGRHLADQDYTICMRQEAAMCSIAYEPCYENSFKLGPLDAPGGPGGIYSPGGVVGGGGIPGVPGGGVGGVGGPGGGVGGVGGPGGGVGGVGGPLGGVGGVAGPGGVGVISEDLPVEPVVSDTLDSGSGDGGIGESRMAQVGCSDRIIMPCDSDDLIMPGISNPGQCDLVHCGTSFCPPEEPLCRVESSVTPFTIGVQFGPSPREESPEDNLGMCLFYQQLPCSV